MKKTYLYLTGGLGNQLFQLSACLYNSKYNYDPLIIDTQIGNPRLNALGMSELESLQFPSYIKVLKKKRFNYIQQRIASYILRSGLKLSENNLEYLIHAVINFIAIFMFSFRYKSFAQIIRSNNLGFIRIERPRVSRILIGYFQSYKYANNFEVYNAIKLMFSKLDSGVYSKFRVLSEKERPLVVHIRLGDYRKEKNFGILSKTYYENALKYQLKNYDYGKIWLFSDETQNCLDFIPIEHKEKVRIFDEPSISSAELLRIMSLGHGYIIANSTLSWWAAFLSQNTNGRIIGPDKWFNLLDDPLDLIPDSWMRFPAHSNEIN